MRAYARLAALTATSSLLTLVLASAASARGRTIEISPISGPAESIVQVTGTGWQYESTNGLDVSVGAAGGADISARPDSDGGFVVSLKIPPSAPGGRLTIYAASSGGSAAAAFTVVGPVLPPTRPQPEEPPPVEPIPPVEVDPPIPPSTNAPQWVCMQGPGGRCIDDPSQLAPTVQILPAPPEWLTSPVTGACVASFLPGLDLLKYLGGVIRWHDSQHKWYVLLTTAMPFHSCTEFARGLFQPAVSYTIDEIKTLPLINEMARSSKGEEVLKSNDMPAELWWTIVGALGILTLFPLMVVRRLVLRADDKPHRKTP
jgi:hypothetical protein